MIVQFSNIDMNDRPILILKRADGTPIGVLGNATNVEFEPRYNEVSVLTFTLPASVDGIETPFYRDVTGQKIIELKGIGQFVVSEPKETGGKLTRKLQVTANSLEREFARKKLTLPESTYKFFDSSNPDGTILGMIMELMPNWGVGGVSSSLYNRYRTFDVSNENLYNLIKGNVQKAYNCIFDFDTMNRLVYVRDADETPAQRQVFLSRENLAKDITVTENPDDLVTRLSVNGAEGVDIREVNPTGSNTLLNLDYFMETGNFSQGMVDRYNAWKTLVNNNRQAFYNDAVRYAILLGEETAETAKLADLQGEYTSLENVQAVIIQGIAQNLRTQSDLDAVNAQLSAKKAEVSAKETEIAAIRSEREGVMADMQAIRDACAFDTFFTEAERRTLDPYIIDNSIEETSFVASEVKSYTDGAGNKLTNKTITVSGADITTTTASSGAVLRSVTGGTINVPGIVTGNIIRAELEKRTGGKVVASVYMGGGTYHGASFPSACLSISGTGDITGDASSASVSVTDGTLYFTLNASDYERKTVAWELYEYGDSMLKKMAVPSYSFSVDSANFIALEQFLLFKNELELGQRIYIEVGKDRILKPICTGARVKWSDRPYLQLMFNDTFTASDGEAKLVELLDNSISMGKTLSAGKFTYEAWTGSGANTALHDFITSALDTAKNAIMSSTEQAVSWDGAGLRLRKWTNDAHTAYEPEQIWMSNNSIMMTDDGWATAKMAIGKFTDTNLGTQWGIIAPMVVGTLLAGESLVIESQKKSGGTSVFKVDSDGAKLFNADFSIQKTNSDNTTTQILMDPSHGFVIGKYPVTNQDGSINTTNAVFYADTNGNLHMSGTINAAAGEIGGWTITDTTIENGAGTANYTALSVNPASNIRFRAGAKLNEQGGMTGAYFYVLKDGTVHAERGSIGGWYIGSNYIGDGQYRGQSTIGMSNMGGDSANIFWAGYTPREGDTDFMGGSDPKFYVTRAGEMHATSAFIEGNVKATSGSIGGWTIRANNPNRLESGSSTTYVALDSSPSYAYAIWAGNTTPGSAPFNVKRTGEIEATSGTIGGWSLSSTDPNVTPNHQLYSGSGSGYVALNSNSTLQHPTQQWDKDTNDWVQPYAIWCGNATAGSAPFRVRRDGKLYCTKLIYLDENNVEQEMNLYQNFSSAISVTMSAGWVGNTFTAYAFRGTKQQTSKHTTIADINTVVGTETLRNNTYIDAKATAKFSGDGGNDYSSGQFDISVNAQEAFDNGKNGVSVNENGLSINGISYSGGVYTVTAGINLSNGRHFTRTASYRG